MSTGDQTAYIRSKVAERGTQKAATFMRDGFDSWAESSAPAREGGLEKEPAMVGGRSRSSISKKYIDDSQMMVHGGKLHGGVSVADFTKLVPELFDFFNNVKNYTTLLKEDLRSEDVPARFQNTTKTIANALEMIGLGKPANVALYESAMKHMPPRRGRVGGAANWEEWFKQVGTKLKQAYEWFQANKDAIHYILDAPSMNEGIGTDLPRKILGAMKSVGLGRRRMGGASCTCSTDGRRVGGMMSADQMAAAARAAMEQVKAKARAAEGTISPQVRAVVAKAKAAEQKARAKIGGRMGGAYDALEFVENIGRKVGGRKPSARGAIVKKVMQEMGLSLPQASKYVKENGLY